MSYELYRQQKLREGAEFQDFIMERLHRIGIVLQTYASASGQQKGENLLGLEIKNDQKFGQTGNLCIEVAEKARPREGDYVPSGIFRTDNTWLYGIGDRTIFWVFSKSTLRNCYAKRTQLGFREYEKPTSRGFLLPVRQADRVHARKIRFNFEGNIVSVENGGAISEINLKAIEAPKEFQMRMDLTPK